MLQGAGATPFSYPTSLELCYRVRSDGKSAVQVCKGGSKLGLTERLLFGWARAWLTVPQKAVQLPWEAMPACPPFSVENLHLRGSGVEFTVSLRHSAQVEEQFSLAVSYSCFFSDPTVLSTV
jgi:hypothetical protein